MDRDCYISNQVFSFSQEVRDRLIEQYRDCHVQNSVLAECGPGALACVSYREQKDIIPLYIVLFCCAFIIAIMGRFLYDLSKIGSRE